MTPQNQLRLANVLMLAGIVPLLISMAWMVSSYSAAAHKTVFIGEALMKIGLAYMAALLVSCGSAIWSFIVGRRNAEVRVSGTTAIRLIVVLVLVLPLVL